MYVFKTSVLWCARFVKDSFSILGWLVILAALPNVALHVAFAILLLMMAATFARQIVEVYALFSSHKPAQNSLPKWQLEGQKGAGWVPFSDPQKGRS
ncbi:MAG: hypothetical protein O7D91_21605, partial [Planctomycetota bacterium]|nr:hypothetical protein [Planctomycetota bacterium]